MGRVAVVLRVLGVVFWRDKKSLTSFASNNFFWVSLILIGPRAGALLYLLLGLVVLSPLSADPLRVIPAERFALWPLSEGQLRVLRIMSPWLNPLTWLFVLLIALQTVTFGLWAVLTALFAVGFVGPSIPYFGNAHAWFRVPTLRGPAGLLITKGLRDILSILDFYLAALLAALAVGFRIAGVLPDEGLPIMTFLIVLALSSYAQCLFGLDGAAGLTRYRLLPLRGWQILAAKGAAFVTTAVALSLPLSPVTGLAVSLVALTIGQVSSVGEYRPQQRWRFSSGASISNGIAQALLMASATAGVSNLGWPVLAFCMVGYSISLCYYGREFEQTNL